MSPEAEFYEATDVDGWSCHDSGLWSLPVLSPDGTWTPGEWRAVGGQLRPVQNGIHLAAATGLLERLGPVMWEAEVCGRVMRRGSVGVARQARLVRGLPGWSERTARLFAVTCAAEVLHLADPEVAPLLEWMLGVARRHADGRATAAELALARQASWDSVTDGWEAGLDDAPRVAASAVRSVFDAEAWRAASDASRQARVAAGWGAEPAAALDEPWDPAASRAWRTAFSAAVQAALNRQLESLLRVLHEGGRE